MSRLFLTGATGFLGSHVAATWLRASDTNTVAALIRADTDDEADGRLKRSLSIAFHDWPWYPGGTPNFVRFDYCPL